MASLGGALPLDLAPTKPWRRLVPVWLRSLIWADSAQKYDAFLSYSWKSDSQVAPVIQSLIQKFLCPWYKLRAKTVFRDLSCLPAGSSLEAELFDRLDRSTHLIVLASPEASASRGMETEARYWFGRPRNGQVLIILSSGDCKTWEEIRGRLVPPALRENLTSEPLWVPLQHRRSKIVANPTEHELHEELTEDLKQVLLRFYPGRDWGQLRGEERKQRRHLMWFLSAAGLIFLVLALTALGFARSARQQLRAVHGRELLLQAKSVLSSEPDQVGLAGLLSLEAWLRAPSELALRQVDEVLHTLALSRAWSVPIRSEPSLVRVHNDAGRVTILQRDRVEVVELSSGKLLRTWMLPEQIALGTGSPETGGAQALIAAVREDGAGLAYAGDHKVLVFDLNVGKIVQEIPYQPSIVSLDLAADTLVVVGKDLRVDGWSLRRGATTSVISMPPLATMPCPEGGADNPNYQIHLSRDGKRLGIYTGYCTSRAGVVPMWLTFEPDGSTSPTFNDFHFLADQLGAFLFSPDARSFFRIREDKIYFGDTNTIPSFNAESLALSEEGRLLASIGLDGIRIWRVSDLAKGTASPEPIGFLQASDIGKQTVADLKERTATGLSGCLLATYSPSNVVSVSDCFRNAVLTRIPVQDAIRSVRFAPGRDLVIIQSVSNVSAVNLRAATLELDTKGEQIKQVIVRNRYVLSCAEESLSYWDLITGQLLRRAQPDKLYTPLSGETVPPIHITSCATMADGSAALFNSFARSVVPDGLSGIIDLRSSDAPKDHIRREQSGEPQRTSTMLISRDSTAITASDPYNWNPDSTLQHGRSSWYYDAAPGRVDLVAANVDGAQVAVVRKNEVSVFDTSTNRTLGSWSEEFDPNEVRFFGDLVELRASELFLPRDSKAVIRDSAGRLRGSIQIPPYANVCQVSRGGDYATVCISSDKTKTLPDGIGSRSMGVRLYRIRDGVLLKEPACCWIRQDQIHDYSSQTHNPTYTRFSPDGKLWAALDGERLVVWALDNNSQLLALEVKGNTPPAFDLTNNWLALAGGGKLEIYDIRSGRMSETISPNSVATDVAWTGPQSILFWGADRIGWRSLWSDPAAALCGGLKTSLSRTEWVRYLPDERWRDTCQAWSERNGFWNKLRSWFLL